LYIKHQISHDIEFIVASCVGIQVCITCKPAVADFSGKAFLLNDSVCDVIGWKVAAMCGHLKATHKVCFSLVTISIMSCVHCSNNELTWYDTYQLLNVEVVHITCDMIEELTYFCCWQVFPVFSLTTLASLVGRRIKPSRSATLNFALYLWGAIKKFSTWP